MIAEVFKYKKMISSISNEIKKSPFRVEHVIKESGFNPGTFYRKLRNNTFTPDEILKILFIIKPEEANDYLFEVSLKKRLKDIEEGNIIDDQEMVKYMEEKYNSFL